MNSLAHPFRKADVRMRLGWLRIGAWLLMAVIVLTIMLVTYHRSPLQLWAPLLLGGDTVSSHYIMKTVIEHGWYLVNPDLGAPFHATMYDYPIPEPTSMGFVWLLGLFTKSPFVVFNLFYCAGFVAAAWAAYWSFQRCGIGRTLAFAGAVAYAILPYHFLRLPHVFLASYFAAPIFCCYALRLALHEANDRIAIATLNVGPLILTAIAAGGGVYYAFFGCLFIAAGAILGAVRCHKATTLRIGAIYISVIVAVIVLSLMPNFLYHIVHGDNLLVANRNPGEAEFYGLKIVQMLLPTTGHRFGWANAFTEFYNRTAPLVNENSTAALGVMGSLGFLIALAVFLFGAWRRLPVLSATGALIATGVLYATIGGFGSLAALLLIPDIRGLNRISVFIAFLALFAFLWLLSGRLRRRPHRLLIGVAALAVVVVACVDQIPTHAMPRSKAVKQQIAAFQQAQIAFGQLQKALPRGTSVYELPYMYYPEEAPVGHLGSYNLFLPYLYTSGLRWSFGGMHGRPADRWNEQVSRLSGKSFVQALTGSGFGAVYLDGAGYRDQGAAINKELAALLGPPIWEFHDKVVYRVPPLPGAKPYAITMYGKGWFPKESDPQSHGGMTWAWSQGNAALEIANPGPNATLLALRFQLAANMPQRVTIRYGNRMVGEYALTPRRYTYVALQVNAEPGISALQLSSDAPAQRASKNDPRKIAFRLINLASGTPLDGTRTNIH